MDPEHTGRGAGLKLNTICLKRLEYLFLCLRKCASLVKRTKINEKMISFNHHNMCIAFRIKALIQKENRLTYCPLTHAIWDTGL